METKSSSASTSDQTLSLDPTSLPVHFKLLARGNIVKTCSEKLGSVKTMLPIPTETTCFYLEVTVEREASSETQYISIGGANVKFPNSVYPGSTPGSFGFSSNGRIYQNGSSSDWSEGDVWGKTGDCIGMGVLLYRREVFFTRNGRYLGVGIKRLDVRQDVFPCISLQGIGLSLSFNFGTQPFQFDVSSFASSLKYANRDKSKTIRSSLMKRIVLDYLLCRGYGKTYDAMKSKLQNDQEILKLTVSNRENTKDTPMQGDKDVVGSDECSTQSLHLHRVFNHNKKLSLPQSNMSSTASTSASASAVVSSQTTRRSVDGFHFEIKSVADIGSLNFRTTVRTMITQHRFEEVVDLLEATFSELYCPDIRFLQPTTESSEEVLICVLVISRILTLRFVKFILESSMIEAITFARKRLNPLLEYLERDSSKYTPFNNSRSGSKSQSPGIKRPAMNQPPPVAKESTPETFRMSTGGGTAIPCSSLQSQQWSPIVPMLPLLNRLEGLQRTGHDISADSSQKRTLNNTSTNYSSMSPSFSATPSAKQARTAAVWSSPGNNRQREASVASYILRCVALIGYIDGIMKEKELACLRSDFQRFVVHTANSVNDSLLVLLNLSRKVKIYTKGNTYDIWNHQSVFELSLAQLERVKTMERQLFCVGKGPIFDISDFYVFWRQSKKKERSSEENTDIDFYLNGNKKCFMKKVIWPVSRISDCYASIFPDFD